jgi:hypothetical protein
MGHRPVRLAYQPPASSNFLSEQTSHQQPAVLFSQNKSAPAISHQPNEQGAWRLQVLWGGRKRACKRCGPRRLVFLI